MILNRGVINFRTGFSKSSVDCWERGKGRSCVYRKKNSNPTAAYMTKMTINGMRWVIWYGEALNNPNLAAKRCPPA